MSKKKKFIDSMKDVSKKTADRIRTGKIKIKSDDPDIQKALDEKFPPLKPVKKMAGGGIAIKGHGKAFTGNK
jgi:hypothetical protein